MNLESLRVKIFADGADIERIRELSVLPWIKGLTTNPTLMRKSGVTDYSSFAKLVLSEVTDKPVSFEVFADDLPTMEAQGREIGAWAPNVNVKIPVTNTQGEFTGPVIGALSRAGIQVNVTAVFTVEQVRAIASVLEPDVFAIVSLFAGRLADTGVDPIPVMTEAKAALSECPKAELLWASPREVLNIVHAEQTGTDIITVTPDLLDKLSLFGKAPEEFSLETVRMFYGDADAAGYSIHVSAPIEA